GLLDLPVLQLVDPGLGGGGLGALLLGGHEFVDGEHLVDAVAVEVGDGHFAVGAQGGLRHAAVLAAVGADRGGAAGGAGGAAPADEHVLPAVAVKVGKADPVHLGGRVFEGGGGLPVAVLFYQK